MQSEYKTLLQCYEEAGSKFPFTVSFDINHDPLRDDRTTTFIHRKKGVGWITDDGFATSSKDPYWILVASSSTIGGPGGYGSSSNYCALHGIYDNRLSSVCPVCPPTFTIQSPPPLSAGLPNPTFGYAAKLAPSIENKDDKCRRLCPDILKGHSNDCEYFKGDK